MSTLPTTTTTTTTDQRISVPPPAEIRRRLAETVAEARALRKLLRLSEAAAHVQEQSRHANREGRPDE
jgi:hypothetical protein